MSPKIINLPKFAVQVGSVAGIVNLNVIRFLNCANKEML